MEQPSTDDRCRWAHRSPDGPQLVSLSPMLNNLLQVEKRLWSFPELRFMGRDGESVSYREGDGQAQALIEHSGLLGDIHDHFRNLEKNRCCLKLAGRRKVLDNLRVVNTDPSDTRLLQGSMSGSVSLPGSGGTRREVVLSGEEQSLYQNALLSAFLPVLAAPAPPSPFTPGPHLSTLPSPQLQSPRASFGYSLYSSTNPSASTSGGQWRSPSTDRDSDPLLNRLSAAASAFANLEKDVSGPCELSPLIVSGWAQAPFDVGPPCSVADVDSVTTDMLRELVRVVFSQTEAQQLCSEHELRESYGRRSYSEVLARHLMTRLSVLENNAHPFYKPSVFLSPQAYDQWVQGEKQFIKQQIHSFWHYPLPHPSRAPSSRVHQINHHMAYVELLNRLVKYQRLIKGSIGVPLLPTASRLLREYGLRFGVGELYRRIVYVEFLSQNVEHDVWFNRHMASALLSVLDLLPAKPSQRTVAVKAELERLHSAMVALHSHIDHALTRIHYLFPNNAPPDGIPSLVQLLSLVLFALRYLTNVQGHSLSHWLRKYVQDSFAWRYDYHKTVSAAELQIVSFVCPVTPSLINTIIIELRNEVLSLKRHFETVFSKYFSISQLGQKFFYQMLMRDVQELCHYKQLAKKLDLDRLALAFRLAELDTEWKDELSVGEQTWREPFFKQSLCWLNVLGKHLVRLVIRSCMADCWSLLELQKQIDDKGTTTRLCDDHAMSSAHHLPVSGAVHTSPVFGGGSSVRSAFARVHTPVSTSALAGSFDSMPEQANRLPNPAVMIFHGGDLGRRADSPQALHPKDAAQAIDIPGRPSGLSLSSRSQAPLSLPNSKTGLNSVGETQSPVGPARRSRSPTSRPPLIFRSENFEPIQPMLLHSPDLEAPCQALFRPLVESPPEMLHSTSSPVAMPMALRPQPLKAEKKSVFRPVVGSSDAGKTALSQTSASSALALSGERTAMWVASVSAGLPMNSVSGFSDNSKTQPLGGDEALVHNFARHSACHTDNELDMRRKVSGQSDSEMRRKVSGQSDSNMRRKVSGQSDVSVRSSVASSADNWNNDDESVISAGVNCAIADSSKKVVPISSSVIELIVLATRFTGFAATLTTTICPDIPAHRSTPDASPMRNSPARSNRSISVSSVASLSLPNGDGSCGPSWSTGMDISDTVASMENQLHSLTLDRISETVMLYADNMLFADLCGVPTDVLEKLVGTDQLQRLKQQHEDGCLFGCQHLRRDHHSNNATKPGHKQPACPYDSQKQTSSTFQSVTLDMCVRINNVTALAGIYPSLQRYLVDQLEGSKVHADRDSGVPFSPLEMFDDSNKDAQLGKVCEHINGVHDSLVQVMAYRLTQFAGKCLCTLVDLFLPNISLSDHLKPVTSYLARHLTEIKLNLYKSSFQKLLHVLWSMLVELVWRKVGQAQAEKTGRFHDHGISVGHATFLLRVFAYLMQFMHSDGAGLSMDVIVETAQPLLHRLHLHTLSTSSLMAIHTQLLAAMKMQHRCHVDLPVETLCRLRRDLHALRKCFTGRQLYDWLSVHGQRLGIHESHIHGIGQSLLQSGLISPVTVASINVDEAEEISSISTHFSHSVSFEDSTSSLYRFTSSDECRRRASLSQLASCLELTHERDEELPVGWQACQRHAANCVLQVLKSRSKEDKGAKVYLTQCSV